LRFASEVVVFQALPVMGGGGLACSLSGIMANKSCQRTGRGTTRLFLRATSIASSTVTALACGTNAGVAACAGFAPASPAGSVFA
jgi:hypothetical protein